MIASAPKAPVIGGTKAQEVSLEESVFGVELRASPRPRDGPRRAERSSRGHARSQEPRTRRRRPLEAVAPEGHGPRPRRHDPRAALDGRRRRFPAGNAQLRGQGQPQGAARRVPRRALRTTPPSGTLAILDGSGFDEAVDPQGRRAPRRLRRAADARRRHRGRGAPREVVPQPREGARDVRRASSRSPRSCGRARSLV